MASRIIAGSLLDAISESALKLPGSLKFVPRCAKTMYFLSSEKDNLFECLH